MSATDPIRTSRVDARLLLRCHGPPLGPSRDYRSQVHNKVLGSSLSQRRVLPGRSEGAVTEHRVQRRLAAILAADVVGYSALMERAEEATYAEFERLKRELIEPSLSRHEGRLIKTTGDGALAEFASPLAATRCAVEIQDHLASGSGPLTLRVGLNLGDVIVGQDGDLTATGSTLLSGWRGSPIRAAS
jgi:class 3 adenylate cyclase